MILRARQHVFEFPRQPLLIGSVRLCFEEAFTRTSDTVASAIAEARLLTSEGADIVALDLESFFPPSVGGVEACAVEICSAFVSAWKEIAGPQLLALRNAPLQVARAVLAFGGDLLMDAHSVRYHQARQYAALCAEFGAGFVAQYSPKIGVESSSESSKVDDLGAAERYFQEVLLGVKESGLSEAFVALGFCLDWSDAATTAASLRLMTQIYRFQHFGRPLVLSDFPASRALERADIQHLELQTAGMVARVVHGLLGGVQLFHTHDVFASRAAVRTIRAVVQ